MDRLTLCALPPASAWVQTLKRPVNLMGFALELVGLRLV